MKKTALIYCFLLLSFFSITGCVFVLGGAAGALGAYGVSRDTIEANTDKPYDMLWSSAVAVSRQRGMITQEDISKGYIEAQAESSRIWIKLTRLTQSATKIRISARKYHFPNLDLAERMFVQIMDEAR